MGFENHIKTGVLLFALTGLFLGVGYLLGGIEGMTFAIILSVIFNFGAYWFSDKIVLAMYHAKEVTEKEEPELYRMVKDVVHLAGIPIPKVYVIPSDAANAFATGRNPKNAAVAVTRGIVSLLSKDELKGVIAHEIGHVKNRDILITTIAATIAGVISYVAMMVRWAALFGGLGGRDREGGDLLGFLALAIVTPIIAVLLQLALSRSREFLADETGAKILHNPHALASALQKLDQDAKHTKLKFGSEATSSLFIVNPFKGNAIMNLLSTHPPMHERIKRLKNMA